MTDGRAGNENQCLGLAAALGVTPRVLRLKVRAPWRWLPPALWVRPLDAIDPAGDRPAPPWPRLLIATGRVSAAPAAAIRRAAQRDPGPAGRTVAVQIQDPRLSPRRFDLVVPPQHDRLRGANVLPTLGGLNGIDDTALAEAAARFAPDLEGLPRPLVAVLIGGANKVYRFDPDQGAEFGAALAVLSRETGAGLAITSSRRTRPETLAALMAPLADVPHRLWDAHRAEPPGWSRTGANPYRGFLALADHLFVTADSVNMVSEACATGKPVHVLPLRGGSPKFRRFLEGFAEAGLARPFNGTLANWEYAPLREAGRIAHRVRALLAET